MPHFIYALLGPTDNIGYVGRSENPQERLVQHLHEAFDCDGADSSAKAAWLRSLDSPPRLRILEEVAAEDDPALRERCWIVFLRGRGAKLEKGHFELKVVASKPRRERRPTALGDRVRQLRTAAGISSRDLGLRIGHSPALIGGIESGRTRHPSGRILAAIAQVLGVDLNELIGVADSAQKGAA